MAAKSLNSIYMGFASFERQLLKMPLTGWVHYKSESSGEFVLLKSPFRSIQFDNCSYVAPTDMRPFENEFVELDVEKPMKEIKGRIKNTNYFNSKTWYRVKDISRPDLNEIAVLEKPYLDEDEFRYRVGSNWKNADQDNLDFSLAIQILSCPESVYGVGGIGTKSISYAGTSKKPLVDLMRSISRLLPAEFLRPGKMYQYNFIQDNKTQHQVDLNRIKGKIPEISFNRIWQLPPPSPITAIQIPTIIHNASYIPNNLELDQDVLEYLLTALMIRPAVEDYMTEKIENTTMRLYEKIIKNEDFSMLNIDPSSPSKIASAMLRLNLREKMTEDLFDHYVTKFTEVTHAFLEVELDRAGNNPDRRTWNVPVSEVSYAEKWKEPIDHIILRIMRKIEEEQGNEYISRADIILHEAFQPDWIHWKLDDSLVRLNNLAKILKSNKGLGYKRYKL